MAQDHGAGLDAGALLDLVGEQEELVRAVVATRTPTVVVLIHGRPLSVGWIADNVPAIVDAWYLGQETGMALARVLFGDVNPGAQVVAGGEVAEPGDLGAALPGQPAAGLLLDNRLRSGRSLPRPAGLRHGALRGRGPDVDHRRAET